MPRNPGLPRRGLLGAAAVLGTALVPGAAVAPAAEPDVRLRERPPAIGAPAGDVLAIGRRIRVLTDRMDAADARWLALPEGAAARECDRLYGEIRDLEDEALVRRPETMGDVAIQAAICSSIAEALDGSALNPERVRERARVLRCAMAGIALCASRAAGVQESELAWWTVANPRREFPGGRG